MSTLVFWPEAGIPGILSFWGQRRNLPLTGPGPEAWLHYPHNLV